MILFTVVRFAAAAFLTGVVSLFFTGCGSGCSGPAEVPASWATVGFKVVEGGTVCAYNDNQITVNHSGYEFPDLFEKYKQQLSSSGWQISEYRRASDVFDAKKEGEEFTIQLGECYKSLISPSTWSKCTRAGIKRREKKTP